MPKLKFNKYCKNCKKKMTFNPHKKEWTCCDKPELMRRKY